MCIKTFTLPSPPPIGHVIEGNNRQLVPMGPPYGGSVPSTPIRSAWNGNVRLLEGQQQRQGQGQWQGPGQGQGQEQGQGQGQGQPSVGPFVSGTNPYARHPSGVFPFPPPGHPLDGPNGPPPPNGQPPAPLHLPPHWTPPPLSGESPNGPSGLSHGTPPSLSSPLSSQYQPPPLQLSPQPFPQSPPPQVPPNMPSITASSSAIVIVGPVISSSSSSPPPSSPISSKTAIEPLTPPQSKGNEDPWFGS